MEDNTEFDYYFAKQLENQQLAKQYIRHARIKEYFECVKKHKQQKSASEQKVQQSNSPALGKK